MDFLRSSAHSAAYNSSRAVSLAAPLFAHILTVLTWFSFGLIAISISQTALAVENSGPQPPKVHYGLQELPAPVRRTALAIYAAARAGDMQAMREVLDMNELKPMIGPMVSGQQSRNIIAHWKAGSIDGSGLDVLAQLVSTLRAGYVKIKHDRFSTLYLWPYFAELPLASLTPRQKVELFRLLPAADAALMLKTGHYTGLRLGIGGDGTWHFFAKRTQKPAPRGNN